MANAQHITAFIRKWEGEYGNDPDDAGGETRKGITYTTWKSVFGDTHERFMAMSDEDWNEIYIRLFWSKIQGDKITSQIVANAVADWAWCSGVKTAVRCVQFALIELGASIMPDGKIGELTLEAINAVNEKTLFDAINVQHRKYLEGICVARPANRKFLKGWNNRIDDLIKFCNA